MKRSNILLRTALLSFLVSIWPFLTDRDANARPSMPFQACPVGAPGDVDATNRGGTGLVVAAVDAENNRVQLNVSGSGSCNAFPLNGAETPGGTMNGPLGVAFGADDRIFVSDTNNDRILRFDNLDGLNFGTPVPFLNVVEPTLGQTQVFDTPEGLGTSEDGRLFVADTGNRRIVILSADGQIDATIGPTVTVEPIATGFAFVAFDEPSDVAVCGQSAAPEYRGRFFVVDRGAGRVLAFDENNDYLFQFGRDGTAVNDFRKPNSIAVDDACVVYIADTENNRIQVFSPDGAILEVFETELGPTGVAVQPGNGTFVATRQDGGIGRRIDVSYDPDANGDIDDDDDGLPDLWEIEGIDTNFDGNLELDLPSLGAESRRRDIFLELDHMPGRSAIPSAISDIVAAFKDAPLQNPDNSTGIVLHVENLSDEVPFSDFILLEPSSGQINDFGDIYLSFFGSPEQRNAPNAEAVLFAKSLAFHYGLMANTACATLKPNDPTECKTIYPNSGFAGPGGKFVVLLRDQRERMDQATTIMHELGHALGLGHGGGDNVNCKPNYLSVMNYSFASQGVLTDVPGENRLDYSRERLDTLDESALNETIGLNNGCGLRTLWHRNGEDVTHFDTACGPINWGGDPSFVTQAAVNLTNSPSIKVDCNDDKLEELKGHDDWANLVYDFRRQSGRLPRETSSIFSFDFKIEDGILEMTREERRTMYLCGGFGLCSRPPFEYVAKFVCGTATEDKRDGFLAGRYATSVNIHNPQDHRVAFLLKIALGHPADPFEPGAIIKLGPHILDYDEVLSVDCSEIVGKLEDLVEKDRVAEGMLVVQAAKSLDVRAFYSAGASGTKNSSYQSSGVSVAAIDAVSIPERTIEQGDGLEAGDGASDDPVETRFPDLLPEDVGEEHGIVGDERFCRFRDGTRRSILVTDVRNASGSRAKPSITRLTFGGAITKDVHTPAIPPSGVARIETPVPPGWPVESSSDLKIMADGKNTIAELNEQNNSITVKCTPRPNE